jgi:hypothetical protein
MSCGAGRDLKQMLANSIHEMAAASEAMSDQSVSLDLRERRLFHAKENHTWASTTFRTHVEGCAACRERHHRAPTAA